MSKELKFKAQNNDVIQSKWIYINNAFCSNLWTEKMQIYNVHHIAITFNNASNQMVIPITYNF